MTRPTDYHHDEPTELDREEDLARQYKAMRDTPDGGIVPIIFCPWCSTGNRVGDAPCCVAFSSAVDTIGKKQLASVERQMREVRLGSRRSMHCPYCDARMKKPKSNHPSDWHRPMVSPVCCELMHDAVLAITQRGLVQAQIEHKKRVEDGLTRAGSS